MHLDLDTIENQKIFLQTSNHPTPHLETELEIMDRLLQKGNTIYWMICNSDFQTCFYNPEHQLMHCQVCHSRVMKGSEVLKASVENHENLHIIRYDEFLTLNQFKTTGYPGEMHFDSLKALKDHYYKDYDNGLATVSSLVSYLRDHEPDLSQHKRFIERGLLTGAYLCEVFELVMDRIQPDMTILFNGRFIENRPLLRVCQRRNLTYATHERGGKMKNFLFRVDAIPHDIQTISKEIDFYWENATDDKIAIGKQFFENRIKRVEDAWYSFTKNQQYGKLPANFASNAEKKVITIFNSSLDEYEGLTGFASKFYDNDNEGIKKIATSLLDFPHIKLYLRVHPNLKGLDNSQTRFINQEIKPLSNVEVIPPEDSVDTYELVDKSDIIIVFTSTVGIEAAYAHKNVVLLGMAMYKELNCAVIPNSHEEFMTILTDENYKFPTINSTEPTKYGYWNEKHGIDFQYFRPTGISSGKYNGKTIKANFILRRIKRLVKWF